MSDFLPALRLISLSMLLAGSAHAETVNPTLVAEGTFAPSVVFQPASPFFINLSALSNQAFQMELNFLGMPTYLGAQEIEDLPGEFIHAWTPGSIHYTFKVGGTLLFSGISSFTSIEVIDDMTVTASTLDNLEPGEVLPPLVKAGGTYDAVVFDVSDIPLGCVTTSKNGFCTQFGQISEGMTLGLQYVWDTAVSNPIHALPGSFSDGIHDLPANFFTGGQGILTLQVWHFDGITGNDIATHAGIASSVTITAAPIPEPETWAMLLAGLGLVGWAGRRRGLRVRQAA